MNDQIGYNGAVRVLSAYDHRHRRVSVRNTVQRLSLPDAAPPAPPPGEWNAAETHTYFYDDWNLVEERIARADGTAATNRYVWGKDSCCDSVGYSTFVTIDSVGFHENKSPWSYGYTMEGKKFSNNHVTANLMPREVEGSQKTFKIRVWIDSDDGEVDCLKRSVTVRY